MGSRRLPRASPSWVDPKRRRGVLSEPRAASPVARLLVLTQLAFNVGFFMVLPYLSVHLSRDLGLAASVVGLTQRLRTFSRQGLFIVGGTLADRWGTAPVVLLGCGLRIVGFLGLAAASSVAGVLAATVTTGFAAELFSPAVEAALSTEAGALERAGGQTRATAFALLSVCGQIGAFTGPLLGALLLLVDFRAACLVAAGVFVLVLAAHLRWLPRTPATHVGEPLLAGWREVLGNRRFVLFALAYSGSWSPTTSSTCCCRWRWTGPGARKRHSAGYSPPPRCWWLPGSCG